MRKPELVAAVAAATGLSKAQAGQVVNIVLDEITIALSQGEDVSLPGFGSFTRRHRAERTGRNPQTGASMVIAASNNVAFKAGKQLRDAVAGS